jgi:ketosteroid isomerase-like protein
MSQKNVEIVRQWTEAYNAFTRGEISSEAYLEPCHPQVEVRWHDRRTYPDTPQRLRGAAEVLSFTEQYREDWADLVADLLEVTELGPGRVLALTRQSARGRQSGVPIVIHYWGLWTIRDGKVDKIEYFRHRADAKEAAELSE